MAARAVVDLHCHTSASFDSLSDPAAVARTAENLGMSWAYWEFGAGFGAYERGTGKWKAELLGALVPAA